MMMSRVEFLGSLPGAMTMTTINLKRAFLKQPPKKPVAPAAFGTLLASFTGSALLERMERHAAEDRLSFRVMANTCVRASRSTSHFVID
jgi:hypothetical protein